jgi:DHA1 family bicyclomycin/chloramphenicol resistance-like MFS transporter
LVIVILSLAYGGTPPLPLLLPCFALWYFAAGFTFGNFNAMSMEPMGHIAGMASSVTGFISQAVGIILGVAAGRFYDGSITSIAIIFFAYALVGLGLVEWAERGRKKPVA